MTGETVATGEIEMIDDTIIQTADENGIIRVSGDFLRIQCVELVRSGRLVQLSRYTFCLPEGG